MYTVFFNNADTFEEDIQKEFTEVKALISNFLGAIDKAIKDSQKKSFLKRLFKRNPTDKSKNASKIDNESKTDQKPAPTSKHRKKKR